MKKILFYDNTINNYFYKLDCESIILDYFDIEVQKILSILGYSYKRNPLLVKNNYLDKLNDINIDYFCNIKKPILENGFIDYFPKVSVVFECYK